MSFQALAWAASQKTGSLAAKAVLLALANYADEEGCAYPSTAALAAFGEMDHKTATAALDRLIAAGLIKDTGEREGRTKQVKVYKLSLNTPPKTEASQKRKPTAFPSKAPQKRGTDTIKEPVSQKTTSSSIVRAKVEKPSDVDAEVWEDFERLRKQKRAPITETALRGIRREADKAGWGMNDALAECCSRGWQSFKADWVKDQKNGHGENSLGRSMDAALDFLSDIRGGKSEGNGRIGGAASGTHPLLGFSG